MASGVLVLGSFVADVAFRAARLPAWGETLMGSAFSLGPGGKGSNQAVAAARAGASVKMLSNVGSGWDRCFAGGRLRDANRFGGDFDR
jgi:ribokinase